MKSSDEYLFDIGWVNLFKENIAQLQERVKDHQEDWWFNERENDEVHALGLLCIMERVSAIAYLVQEKDCMATLVHPPGTLKGAQEIYNLLQLQLRITEEILIDKRRIQEQTNGTSIAKRIVPAAREEEEAPVEMGVIDNRVEDYKEYPSPTTPRSGSNSEEEAGSKCTLQ